MCGIFSFFSRESVLSKNEYDLFFQSAAKRGNDSFGFIIIDTNNKNNNIQYYLPKGYLDLSIEEKNEILEKIQSSVKLNNILLCNFRAAPETEIIVDKNNLKETIQPINNTKLGLYLTHNGAISNEIYKQLKNYIIEKYSNEIIVSKIDSEAIIWAYDKNNRNLKQALENDLSGGWSFIMYDEQKRRLLSACSANPMVHGYIKGVGYFIHSYEDAFPNVMKSLGRRVTNLGSVVWEDFYWHERDGFRYFELDIDSGCQTAGTYKHFFINQNWNSKQVSDKNKYLVSLSGGLDSTTTACILHNKNFDFNLVHFMYGHRGEECELNAAKNIARKLNKELIIFDLRENYKKIDNFTMLTNENNKVITGMNPKTTNAWTCGRNMIFMSYLGALSESMIMKENLNKVFICGGWSNLTESGVYPDNTEKFVYSMEQVWKYGTLPGAHNRIKHINVCSMITKSEQILLLKEMNMVDILKMTISCDRPIIHNGIIKQCSTIININGKDTIVPACGSGLLSFWARKKANIDINIDYYQIDDNEYKPFLPHYLINDNKLSYNKEYISNIQKRLVLE